MTTPPTTPAPVTGTPVTAAPATGNAVREFLDGLGFLGRGIGMWARSPRLLLIGVIPAVISLIVIGAAIVALAFWIGDLVDWLTPFADDWSSGAQTFTRVTLGVLIIGGALLLAVVAYTALTLLIGDPFYETISRRVEDRLGGVPGAVEVPWYRSIVDSLRLIVMSIAVGIPLFVAGFIPVVGQSVVPVIGALVGGWLLALEIVGVPFNRRGLRLADRRRLMRQRRPLALGFGVGMFVLFLIPLGAIVVMPAAVAGGTLLARHVLGAPDQPVG